MPKFNVNQGRMSATQFRPAGQAVAPAPSQPVVIVAPQANDNFWWGVAAGLAVGFFLL